ncbi:unnamed protein product [Boreogadus saida]
MAAFGMVQMLIEAAEYLDRREREAEHGYASLLPFTSSKERDNLKRKSKSKKNTSSRYTLPIIQLRLLQCCHPLCLLAASMSSTPARAKVRELFRMHASWSRWRLIAEVSHVQST